MDYYMICSRDYQNILEQYTALTGRSPMIPRWAFGFWMSKMSYLTRDEVEQTVDRMASFGMSADPRGCLGRDVHIGNRRAAEL